MFLRLMVLRLLIPEAVRLTLFNRLEEQYD